MKTADRLYLPFDQYSRQELVRKIVDEYIRPFTKQKGEVTKLKIIDLGGHKGHTQDFFPEDSVTILDVFDEKYENYVKGDATNTPFANNEFDIAVSFDTLEHIPSELREKFISEAARISKYAFLIAAPFDNSTGDISHAEVSANELYKSIHGKEHPWLAEHISYKTPKRQVTEESIVKTQNYYFALPTNNLYIWLLMQGLMFNASALTGDIKEVVDVSKFYNENMPKLEKMSGESYRQIYVCSKHETLVNQIKDAFVGDNKEDNTATHIEFMGRINGGYAALVHQLKKDVDYLQEREKHLQSMYDEAMDQYAELQNIKQKLQLDIEADHKSTAWKIKQKFKNTK